jgi:hypothetical protein
VLANKELMCVVTSWSATIEMHTYAPARIQSLTNPAPPRHFDNNRETLPSIDYNNHAHTHLERDGLARQRLHEDLHGSRRNAPRGALNKSRFDFFGIAFREAHHPRDGLLQIKAAHEPPRIEAAVRLRH